MPEFQLTREIIARSNSKVWDQAKLEWVLHEVFESEEPETCLCGHYPIIENCVLRNRINSVFVTVGNCCVKRFIGLPSNRIFQAVKRVRLNSEKSLNTETIDYAHQHGWFNDWERDFYFRIMRKRNLTSKQLAKKLEINEKVLLHFRQARFPVSIAYA